MIVFRTRPNIWVLASCAGVCSGLGGCDAAPQPEQADDGELRSLAVTVSRAQMGAAWPFTISQGKVGCSRGGLVFIHGGQAYALNGTALTQPGVIDLLEADFWAPNPKNPGTKKSIQVLSERASGTCET